MIPPEPALAVELPPNENVLGVEVLNENPPATRKNEMSPLYCICISVLLWKSVHAKGNKNIIH